MLLVFIVMRSQKQILRRDFFYVRLKSIQGNLPESDNRMILRQCFHHFPRFTLAVVYVWLIKVRPFPNSRLNQFKQRLLDVISFSMSIFISDMLSIKSKQSKRFTPVKRDQVYRILQSYVLSLECIWAWINHFAVGILRKI